MAKLCGYMFHLHPRQYESNAEERSLYDVYFLFVLDAIYEGNNVKCFLSQVHAMHLASGFRTGNFLSVIPSFAKLSQKSQLKLQLLAEMVKIS